MTEEDLPIFFEHQRDPDATRMAAFPPRERPSFMAHWTTILGDESVVAKTVVVQFIPKGATRRIDVSPAPGNCPF